MTQISLQPVSDNLLPIGNPIYLEVSSFTESRQAKLVTYSRAQAYLDTSLVIGTFNPAYEMTTIVPQDFTRGEDIETLLAGLQYQIQLLTNAEGEGDYIMITQISPSHTGGQPFYYSVDIAATSLGLGLKPPSEMSVSLSGKALISQSIKGEIGIRELGVGITSDSIQGGIGSGIEG